MDGREFIVRCLRLTGCDRYNSGYFPTRERSMHSQEARLILFGHPVAHSLSPRIQQAFAAQCGVRLDYACQDVGADEFASRVREFFAAGGHGANVTVPHKRAAFELADEASEAALRAGVANVLLHDEHGRILADNTDGSGLLADLIGRRGLTLAGMHVLLLGAGGAAHGVVGPLLEAGIESLQIANRTQSRARALADELDERVQAVAMESLAALESFDLIVNATSAGHQQQSLELPQSLVDRNTACCDLSYGAAAAAFVHWAGQAGSTEVFDGLGMLVETAADSFELWFDQRPDTEPVFRQMSRDG